MVDDERSQPDNSFDSKENGGIGVRGIGVRPI